MFVLLFFVCSDQGFDDMVGTCCYLKAILNLPVSLLPWHTPCLPVCLLIHILGHNLVIFNFAYPLASSPLRLSGDKARCQPCYWWCKVMFPALPCSEPSQLFSQSNLKVQLPLITVSRTGRCAHRNTCTSCV